MFNPNPNWVDATSFLSISHCEVSGTGIFPFSKLLCQVKSIGSNVFATRGSQCKMNCWSRSVFSLRSSRGLFSPTYTYNSMVVHYQQHGRWEPCLISQQPPMSFCSEDHRSVIRIHSAWRFSRCTVIPVVMGSKRGVLMCPLGAAWFGAPHGNKPHANPKWYLYLLVILSKVNSHN